jgi:hypothetical protein
VRFGISLIGTQPNAFVELAVGAELLGFDSVRLGEHVIVPREFASEYPYSNARVVRRPHDGTRDVMTQMRMLADRLGLRGARSMNW